MTGLLPNYHGAQSQIDQLEHASFDIKYLLTDNSLNEWSVCVFLSKIAIDHTESTRKLVLKQGNGFKRVNIKFLCLSPSSGTKSFNFLRRTSSNCFCTSMYIYFKTTTAVTTTAQWI